MKIIFNNLSYPNEWSLMGSIDGDVTVSPERTMRIRLDFTKGREFTIDHLLNQAIKETFCFDSGAPDVLYKILEAQVFKSVVYAYVLDVKFEKCEAKPYEAPAIEEEGELKDFNVEVYIKHVGQIKARNLEEAKEMCQDSCDIEDFMSDGGGFYVSEVVKYEVGLN